MIVIALVLAVGFTLATALILHPIRVGTALIITFLGWVAIIGLAAGAIAQNSQATILGGVAAALAVLLGIARARAIRR